MVENELESMYHNLQHSLSMQGMNAEDYLEQLNMTREEWEEQNQEAAESRARGNLVLETIAKKEGIEVSDQEIDNRIEKMAEGNERKPEDIKKILQLQGQLDELVYSMKMEKVLDFLEENN